MLHEALDEAEAGGLRKDEHGRVPKNLFGENGYGTTLWKKDSLLTDNCPVGLGGPSSVDNGVKNFADQ